MSWNIPLSWGRCAGIHLLRLHNPPDDKMKKENIIKLMSNQARKLNGELASYNKYSLEAEALVDIQDSIRILDDLLVELQIKFKTGDHEHE